MIRHMKTTGPSSRREAPRRLPAGLAILMFLAAPAASPAQTAATPEPQAAAPAEEKPAPYDERLARLSEIIGSVQYMRNLCSNQSEDTWRQSMQQLLDTEARDEPRRRERLTAAYNRGFRAFAAVYTTCTDSALVAEENYRAEGATLASEIVARFGN